MALLHHFARGAAPVFLALLLIGCAGTDVNRSARWGLAPDGAFYVAWPVDPRYTEVFHERLGRELALRYPSSLLAVREESASAALASARYAGADYLFYPVIEITAARRGFWRSSKAAEVDAQSRARCPRAGLRRAHW